MELIIKTMETEFAANAKAGRSDFMLVKDTHICEACPDFLCKYSFENDSCPISCFHKCFYSLDCIPYRSCTNFGYCANRIEDTKKK